MERGLRGARQRRDRHIAVHVLEALVDLPPLVGLVDHPPHLFAEQVAGDEDPAGLAEVEHVGQQVVVAGVDLQAVDLGQVGGVGLLDSRRCSRAGPSSASRSLGMSDPVRCGML